jgi:hypothetical protein
MEDAAATAVEAEAGQDSSITVNVCQEGHEVGIAAIEQPSEAVKSQGWEAVNAHGDSTIVDTPQEPDCTTAAAPSVSSQASAGSLKAELDSSMERGGVGFGEPSSATAAALEGWDGPMVDVPAGPTAQLLGGVADAFEKATLTAYNTTEAGHTAPDNMVDQMDHDVPESRGGVNVRTRDAASAKSWHRTPPSPEELGGWQLIDTPGTSPRDDPTTGRWSSMPQIDVNKLLRGWDWAFQKA